MEPKTDIGQRPRPEMVIAKGADVALIKRQVFGKAATAVDIGHGLVGKLTNDITVGQPVDIGRGNTSPVSRILISELDGRVSFDTQTSRYEVLDKRFKGLTLDTQDGSIRLPVDSQPARLDDRVVDFYFPTGRVHIDKPALIDILLETQGVHLFRAVDNRFMVLAKVGNIHLPFYVSSGTNGGKNSGEWYPFFGYTGDWMIKGQAITPQGAMEYHPQIDAVREALNRHLILPSAISPQGALGPGPVINQEPGVVMFDINNHLKYRASGPSPEEEKQFVDKMTGYAPRTIVNKYESAMPWINAVVGSIK